MSETKITKTTKKAANTKAKESKVMKKEEVAVVETAVEAVVENHYRTVRQNGNSACFSDFPDCHLLCCFAERG